MQLSDEQKQKVVQWLEAGAKLSDIQQRLADELGVRLTYMEARFLLDDLQLSVKETVVPEPAAAAPERGPAASVPPAGAQENGGMEDESGGFEGPESGQEDLGNAPAGGGVSVTVDTLARPGAMVSGAVVFSDGNRAEWYLDQMGRLGMKAENPGYRPPQADIVQFQQALDRELARMGF